MQRKQSWNNIERLRKNISCASCGKEAKLVVRRNYSHGVKSNSITTKVYKCGDCNWQSILNKEQGGKNGKIWRK